MVLFYNRNIWLTKDDNTNLGKENCKQGFDFSAKTKESNQINCGNNVTVNVNYWIRIFCLSLE